MNKSFTQWQQPPRHLGQVGIHLDNVALVPASELANMDAWQQQAQLLPPHQLLVVLPNGNAGLHKVGQRIQRSQMQRGRHVRLTSFLSPHDN